MVPIADVTQFLRQIAPLELAADWDNVGLLVGDESAIVTGVMTCLTLTPDVAAEAVQRRAGLIVAHHPVLFRPVQRLTGDSPEGRLLLDLIAARVAVFSAHTGYDSAADGINSQLCRLLELQCVAPLRPAVGADGAVAGAGRCGALSSPLSLAEFLDRVKAALRVERLQYVGALSQRIERVAVACGSAAEFILDACRHGCQVLLTGEARFHACLEARAMRLALVLAGHYATERPAMEHLARVLAQRFPQLPVWASAAETDPLRWA